MEWLQIRHIRNLESVQFSPGPGLNFFVGMNASGKTAILEAIFILSRGKSFRTPKLQDVIRNDQTKLLVSGKVQHDYQGQITTGIEKGYGELQIRYNGVKVKTISEQTKAVPVILITQDTHLLITAGPRDRRHWLDWAMFHVEPDYLETWKVYMKALRHRNMLLKKGVVNREFYRAWEQAMVESGAYLAATRKRFLNELTEELARLTAPVFQGQIRLDLSSDWPKQQMGVDMFADSWPTDLKSGYTRSGAHNVDVAVKIDNKGVAALFSRGQTKLFVCLLSIAQAWLQARRTGIKPLILIDDYMAELDRNACEYLLSTLMQNSLQVFLTDTEQRNIIKNNNINKMFHVEHGVVTQI